MKRTYWIDLALLLFFAGLLFAIGCGENPDEPSGTTGAHGSAVITGPSNASLGDRVTFDGSSSKSYDLQGEWHVQDPDKIPVDCELSDQVIIRTPAWYPANDGGSSSNYYITFKDAKCTITPDKTGRYAVDFCAHGETFNVGTPGKTVCGTFTYFSVSQNVPTAVSVLPAEKIFWVDDSRTLSLEGAVTDPDDTPALEWRVVGAERCDVAPAFDAPASLTPTLTVGNQYGSDCTFSAKLTATTEGGSAFDAVTVTVKARPSTGGTGGTGGTGSGE